MARVVQQQKSNPPYLLILFVFLFLVATVVAVLVYLDGDKAKKEAERLAKTNNAVVGPTLDSPAVQAMIGRWDQDHSQTVVSQMQQKIDQLTQFIAGSADAKNAVPLTEQAYTLMGSRPGLASAVLDAYGKLAEQKDKIQKLDADIASLKGELAQKAKEIADLGAARDKERTELNGKITELDGKVDALTKEREKAVAELTADRDREIKSRDQNIARLNDKSIKDEKTIKELRDQIEKGKETGPGPVIGLTDRGPQPNGKVMSVSGSDTLYIGLGQKDRVRPGMSFSVYPASGIPSDPNNSKGKIVVTSVTERGAQCRITLLRDKNNPMLPDDLVYNLFFERARTLKFVVVGLFDIYGTSYPSAQGAEEVRLLIQRYGGTVENEVTTDTDYVVIGDEPAAPKAAAEGATAAPPSPEVEKIRAAFAKAREEAGKARIPVLNTNRFLNLIGFDPSVATGIK